ncbi:MAG: methenyltetrahydromethanopterin cyclohydrolase, partial [Planctomycetota bacterium]
GDPDMGSRGRGSQDSRRRSENVAALPLPGLETRMNASDSRLIGATGLNESARRIYESMKLRAAELGIAHQIYDSGAELLDCGVDVPGGLAAGLEFAQVCLAGRADVSLATGDRAIWNGPWVQVASDDPVRACMYGQYAGWPVKHGDYFAMGSGPMRVRRGREEMLVEMSAHDEDACAVGTLESGKLPADEVLVSMANDCEVAPNQLRIAIAPTSSIAGCVQVVARSVETALHKIHELGGSLHHVQSAYGYAPLCPPSPDFAKGIGRTNDAILYGGHVTIWIEGDDAQFSEMAEKLPSNASSDFGAPFAEIFKRYDFDFYKIDPGLFSPAEITLLNLKTGNSFTCGELRGDLVQKSFTA